MLLYISLWFVLFYVFIVNLVDLDVSFGLVWVEFGLVTCYIIGMGFGC